MSKVTREQVAAGEAALSDHYDKTRGSRRQTLRKRVAQVAAPLAITGLLWAMLPDGGEKPDAGSGDSGYSDSGAGNQDNNAEPQQVEGVVPEPSVSASEKAASLYCKLAGVTAISTNGRIQTVLANMDVRGAQLGATDTNIHVPLIKEGMIVPGSDANAKANPDQSVLVTIPADSGPENVYGLYLSAPDADNDGEPEETRCGGFFMEGEIASMVSVSQLPESYDN